MALPWLIGRSGIEVNDEIVAWFRERGFKVNNLFERCEGRWQMNVRRADMTGSRYVVADTPMEAIAAMMHEVSPGSAVPERRTGRIEALCVALAGLTLELRKSLPADEGDEL